MQVPPIFYKSTNIVLCENHKGICSGQMVPTPKIYGIGSWTIRYAGRREYHYQRGPFLSVMSDSSTDPSVIDQEVILLRYGHASIEDVMTFIPPLKGCKTLEKKVYMKL